MNIVGDGAAEDATGKDKAYDDKLAALEQAEANVEQALANQFSGVPATSGKKKKKAAKI